MQCNSRRNSPKLQYSPGKCWCFEEILKIEINITSFWIKYPKCIARIEFCILISDRNYLWFNKGPPCAAIMTKLFLLSDSKSINVRWIIIHAVCCESGFGFVGCKSVQFTFKLLYFQHIHINTHANPFAKCISSGQK